MTMMDVYNLEKEKISEAELNDQVFGVPIKSHVIHQVVVGQLSQRHSGSAHSKSRSQVKGSSRKLWRQKGTGRARVGAASSPTRKGGGVAFGPKPRSFELKVPKKVKKAALRMALTDKVQTDQLFVIDSFELQEIKTKQFVEILKHFDVSKALIVTRDKCINLEKSSGNVPRVKVMRYEGLNVYDVLKYDHLFLEQSTIEKIEEALGS